MQGACECSCGGHYSLVSGHGDHISALSADRMRRFLGRQGEIGVVRVDDKDWRRYCAAIRRAEAQIVVPEGMAATPVRMAALARAVLAEEEEEEEEEERVASPNGW